MVLRAGLQKGEILSSSPSPRGTLLSRSRTRVPATPVSSKSRASFVFLPVHLINRSENNTVRSIFSDLQDYIRFRVCYSLHL